MDHRHKKFGFRQWFTLFAVLALGSYFFGSGDLAEDANFLLNQGEKMMKGMGLFG